MWQWIIMGIWLGGGYWAWGYYCAEEKEIWQGFVEPPSLSSNMLQWVLLFMSCVGAGIAIPIAIIAALAGRKWISHPYTFKEWQQDRAIRLLSE